MSMEFQSERFGDSGMKLKAFAEALKYSDAAERKVNNSFFLIK